MMEDLVHVCYRSDGLSGNMTPAVHLFDGSHDGDVDVLSASIVNVECWRMIANARIEPSVGIAFTKILVRDMIKETHSIPSVLPKSSLFLSTQILASISAVPSSIL